jgi:hypothetical protein
MHKVRVSKTRSKGRALLQPTTQTVKHSVAAFCDHSGRGFVFENVQIGESDSSGLLTARTYKPQESRLTVTDQKLTMTMT